MLSISETEEKLNKRLSTSYEFKYKILALYGKAVVDRLEKPKNQLQKSDSLD